MNKILKKLKEIHGKTEKVEYTRDKTAILICSKCGRGLAVYRKGKLFHVYENEDRCIE